jgi:aspartyl-tRNA(Asn)/glutamyl-tRNA(Gln) amidotransferase subunit B
MRAKEEAQDYRYFDDPDLAALEVAQETIERVAESLPELPRDRAARFVSQYGLPEYDAGVLTGSRDLAGYFEAVVEAGAEAKAASNWIMGDVMRHLGEEGIEIDQFPIEPRRLAELVQLQSDRVVNSSTARRVFADMLITDEGAGEIVERKGLEQLGDESVIEDAARRVIESNPDEAERYREGKTKLLQFFVGQVMKETRGKADPVKASEILMRLLARSPDS